MAGNPFAEGYVAPEPEPEGVKPKGPLITAPGAYPDIAIEDYHSNVDLCPAPSLSSSGIKTLLDKSPAHFWFNSPLNPERPAEIQKPHLNLGKAIHDALLLPERWSTEFYHVVPDGFTPAHHIKWADEMPAYRRALKDGKAILSATQAAKVARMAEKVEKHELAKALLISGTPEMTLAWQDEKTGVWCKARPDVTPDLRAIIPDVKSALNPSPAAFEKHAATFRYFNSAALYLDGLDVLFGEEKRRFIFVVIESDEPFTVTLYQADEDDLNRARMENRKAIDLFAKCLKRNAWPEYATGVLPLQLPPYVRARIDREAENGTLSYY